MPSWTKYFNDKRVWVTGASSGIGRAIAEALAHHNVTTLVSARRADLLQQLAAAHDLARLPADSGPGERFDRSDSKHAPRSPGGSAIALVEREPRLGLRAHVTLECEHLSRCDGPGSFDTI